MSLHGNSAISFEEEKSWENHLKSLFDVCFLYYIKLISDVDSEKSKEIYRLHLNHIFIDGFLRVFFAFLFFASLLNNLI